MFLPIVCGCSRDLPPQAPPAPHAREADDLRQRAAAVSLRFENGHIEWQNPAAGSDRLSVAAVFADVDRRDLGLLGTLVGQPASPASQLPIDTCVRQSEANRPLGAASATRPHSWMQLLDVGNLELRAGAKREPLRVQLVPPVIESARGVRYDLAIDQARTWLQAGSLTLQGTGGDGAAAFAAAVTVPRPVRVSHIGQVAVRQGVVQGVGRGEPLLLRWGSIDGTAELELLVGSDEPGTLSWLRCNLRDDGEFVVPAALTEQLPERTPQRPWLVVLLRRVRSEVPGFAGKSLWLELTDSVRLL
ncbi:MAG: hypothetical protein HY902_14990 [Deltaproteobacteria bacterium]|nr:hypothetical protein [Deltaproteobacteria bacterium]